jgi:Uma2 family endonuclease
MTYADYVAFERGAETKHEYVNGEVYAMAGGSPEHARLQARLARLLGNALEDQPCEVFSSDLRVRVLETKRSTYPDITVVCGRLETADDDPDAVTNPRLIVEVLSPGTEGEDRGSKWSHYQRLGSLEEYVLVSQHDRRVEVFRRDGARWSYESFSAESEVVLKSIGVTLSLQALYASGLDRG